MKKLSFLLMVLTMVCINVVAFAAKPYKHPSYNFNEVSVLHIVDIDDREGEPREKFRHDENAELKVLGELLQNASKFKLIVKDDTDNKKFAYDDNQAPNLAPKSLELRVIINNFGYTMIHKPGYYEDYTVKETRYYYDRAGVRHSYQEDVVRQRWVPERNFPMAFLSIVYNFYDPQNGTLVASFSDNREREDEDDPAGGMLGRSVRDCYNKVLKKTK